MGLDIEGFRTIIGGDPCRVNYYMWKELLMDREDLLAETLVEREIRITPIAEPVPLPVEWADWMVDNIPEKYLAEMARDIIQHAIATCNTSDLGQLSMAIKNWKATIEELSCPPEEREAILEAAAEVRAGGGLSWDEFWQDLDYT